MLLEEHSELEPCEDHMVELTQQFTRLQCSHPSASPSNGGNRLTLKKAPQLTLSGAVLEWKALLLRRRPQLSVSTCRYQGTHVIPPRQCGVCGASLYSAWCTHW